MIDETYQIGYCINIVGNEWVLALGVVLGFLLAMGINIAMNHKRSDLK